MSEKTVRFQAEVTRTGATTTGVVVPAELVAQLGGGARPAVVAIINDYVYRTTVGVMKGRSMLPFSAQHREASGIGGGDPIEVELTLDREPRTAQVPADLAEALCQAGVEGAFKKQANSRQRADIESLATAKSEGTRARRIQAIVSRNKRDGGN